jgi:aryl-alcohol dehydrogenase-like predicted oxidoreductase
MALDPTRTAIGTWSGGRFMHFGQPLDDERYLALIRPGNGIDTVVTADVYGQGEADTLLGRALRGVERDSFSLVGAVGHDFYDPAHPRAGAKGFPRFTDPQLRGPGEYASYLRMAAERSLERIGTDSFDLLLLHNPDRTGYSSEAVWDGMAALRDAGLTRLIGVAPGPANGFTLDVVDCLDRFGDRIDWAMLILNPLEPWPGELALPACERHGVRALARVVDYGGLFHGGPIGLAERDHRAFRPAGWIEAGQEKIERMRPIAERHGLTTLQLACAWDLSHGPVASVVPTLIQEANGRPVEEQRADLAALPDIQLDESELAELRAIGDNTGSMTLKGASAEHEGAPLPDRWALTPELAEVGARYGVAQSALVSR